MSTTTTKKLDNNEQSSFFDLHNESSLSSCSSSPPISSKLIHNQNENDSGCGSDDDPALALKINKGLSMGYDYELIKSVIQQQNDGDDMSKFIETIVRTAEVNSNSNTSSSSPPPPLSSSSSSMKTCSPTTTTTDTDCSDITIPHDVYIIDGADLAFSYGNNSFSWRGIEICLKYLHSHGHKKVYVVLPYSLKNHRHDQNFSESKSLRDLERKTFLVYTNRMSKQTNKPSSYTHISEMLKFSQKTKGYLITNVSLKDVILDFTIYKQILEGKVIRYRFQNDNFQPLLVTIINDDDGNDCETHYPLCPYGKKCTYGLKCKYFHIERRHQNPLSITETLQMKARLEKSKIQHYLSTPTMINNNGFNHTKSGPEHLHMYSSPIMDQSLVDDARIAYEYGLTSTPISNDFSFVDQRISPIQQTRQTWFNTPNQQHPLMNRTYSMPQQQQMNDMTAAMIMQQQQQNWARQQMFPMQQQQPPPQQFEQNVLRFLSMLSLQQQQTTNNSMTVHTQQQENLYDRQSVNSQQGLADKIQAVRHLWETENVQQQQQMSTAMDPSLYNPMMSTFQQPSQNFFHYN
ncbi:unnamed protein product [Adineta steineri]|uniref:C3H1-type domain-containing protein n=1 Tax=Adineta steineri TaxID=433720 RepID=A0A818MYD4_9BILA|nr:unnamed protein product [Adineta steineri]CAF1466458.1 unnamed protein product [Adineta steineri]CAF3596943.1 unnamed protein product [Adineta steineri]